LISSWDGAPARQAGSDQAELTKEHLHPNRLNDDGELASVRQHAERPVGESRSEANLPDEMLKAALAGISDGLAIVDYQWRLTYVNDNLTKLAGMQKAQMLGKNIWEMFPFFAGTKLFDELHRSLEQQIPVRFEYFYAPRNRWSALRVYPSEVGLLIFSADITERKQREELLGFQASVLAQVKDVVFAIDSQLRVTYWNQAAELFYGHRGDDVMGRKIVDVIRYRWVQPEDEEACGKALAANGFWQGEVIQRKKNGEDVHVETSVSVVKGAAPAGDIYLAIMRDITERKRVETELRRAHEDMEKRVLERTAELSKTVAALQAETVEHIHAEQALQAANETLEKQAQLLDRAHDAILVRKVDSSIVSWNSGAEKTYGWTEEEAIGKVTHNLLQTVFPVFPDGVESSLDAKGFWEGELIHTRRDGVRITVASRQVLQRDSDGQPVAILEINRDISERKRAEDALREGEARLRALVESMDDVAFEFDENGTYQNVWTANERLLARPKQELIGQRLDSILGKESASLFQDAFKRVLATGLAESIEYPLDLAGERRWFSGRISPIRSEVGAHKNLCLLIREITERKRLEDALKKSEERLRSTVEDVDVGLAVVGPRTEALLFNAAALELLGLTREQLTGLSAYDPLWKVIHEDGTPFTSDDHPSARAVATKQPVRNVVARVYRPSKGDRKWLLCNAVPHLASDGSVTEVICSFSDITAQKETETALKESEERFRLMVESVRDYAIFMLDTEGSIRSWNLGAQRVKGYRRDEIIGQHFSIFYPLEEVRSGKPARELEIAIEEGRFEEEGWRIRKDGTRFWANVLITAVRDQAGKLRGFAKVTRDITERKMAEDSLRELSGNLLHLQDEERRRMSRELHDSTAQVLSALTLNLAVVKQVSEIHEHHQASRALAESMALAEQASREIRTFSYLLHPPLLDEAGLSHALRWYVDGFVRRTNIKIELEIPAEPDRLSRDQQMALFRIVQESLTNIHRHSASPKAEILLAQGSNEVTLEVRDHGKGLPDTRGESHYDKPVTIGVGIRGMRERVRQLGGKLEIVPANPGTLVRAVLPLAEGAARLPAPSGGSVL